MQSINFIDIEKTISALLEKSQNNRHRLPILLCMPEAQQSAVLDIISQFFDKALLIDAQSTLKANEVIGHENDLIVILIEECVDANLIAALAGTLKSGGIFLFTLANRLHNPTPFVEYFLNKLENNPNFLKIDTNRNKISISLPKTTSIKEKAPNFSRQLLAIKMAKSVITGHRNRPLVITANRGRGKSAAIGIAIGELLQERTINVTVTAPSLAAVSVIFKHVRLTEPTAKFARTKITFKESIITFIAPDELQKNLHEKIDLLVVDEAAGHNPSFLVQMLEQHSRIIFSTTIHGYEGSGYGFLRHFKNTLNTKKPLWKSIELTHPIRWANDDPLENFIDDAFLLSSIPDDIVLEDQFSVQELQFQVFHKENITDDHALLMSVFSLLKSAHYKTSPNDLRHLMDAKDTTIFVAFCNQKLIATAIIIDEGNFDENLSEEIYRGNRRPKGHFLPQSLISHLGLKNSAQLRYLRIMRISVHSNTQQRNIGSKLVEKIIEYSIEHNYDYVGCSFGATVPLVSFWKKSDFRVFRMGYKKNNFSGCHAALMLKPISDIAIKHYNQASSIFIENFICQLSHSLNDLNSNLIITILNNIRIESTEKKLDKLTLDNMNSYAYYNRSYDDIISSIYKFSELVILKPLIWKDIPIEYATILILRVLQNKDWNEVCHRLNLSGKKQGIILLKDCFKYLLKQLAHH